MQKTDIMKNLFLLLTLTLFWSCGPVINLESGRTNGESTSGIQGNLVAFYGKYGDNNTKGVLPFAELKYSYGVASKFDLGISATSGGNAQFFTKYQFLGDQESKVAMSLGLKIGKQLSVNGKKGPTRFYLPLYFSIHPSEKVAFFLNPMYAKQKVKNDFDSDFFGFTTGSIFYINENEIFLGANYNFVKTNTTKDDFLTFGAGYKFKF